MTVVFGTGFEIQGDAETEPAGGSRHPPMPWSTSSVVGASGGVNNDADSSATYVKNGRYSVTLKSGDLYETPQYTASADTEWWVSGWFKLKSAFQDNVQHMIWHCSDALSSGDFLTMYFHMVTASTNTWSIGLRRYTNSEATYGIATGTVVGTYAVNDTNWHWIQLHLTDNGDTTFDAEILVDDTQQISGTSIGSVTNTTQMVTAGAYPDSAKSTSSWAMDDFIINDTNGSAPYNARLASTANYCHQGYQVTNDLTDYNDWTESTGTRQYACIDDYNDTTDSADDYTGADASGGAKSQMFCLATFESGKTPVAVNLINWQRISGLSGGQEGPQQYMALVVGETLDVAAWDYTYGGAEILAFKYFLLTPDGNAWTETRFNNLKVGFKATDTTVTNYRVYTFGVEVLGANLARPTATSSNTNDDCTIPTTTFVPQVIMI